MYTISVLMSVYKSDNPKYFDRALQSVFADQTLKPKEIILVEDGPLTKELYQTIEKWKSILAEKLIILKNETNIGLTKSLNKGIEMVTGDYVARMDSDDISLPDRFEKQKDFLDKNPDIYVVGGAIQEFDEKNECYLIRTYPRTSKKVCEYIHKASPLAHPTVMIRKRIFESGLRYNESFRTSQDIALWFDVLSKGYQIGNLEDVTLLFRRDDGVFKRRSKDKALNEFKIYMQGIYMLNGIMSFKYIYPLARFIFRMMPVSFIKKIYGSKLRTLLFN